MHGCIKCSLREPFKKDFSPGPLKNNHKINGTNKNEKLKKINMHGCIKCSLREPF